MAIVKRDVVGLYYHVVSDKYLPHIQHLYSYKSPGMFENDLKYLAKNFNLITYEELAAHYYGSQRLKPRSLILTFDDGFSECYSVVRPLLLKHGIPCVFFITTDYMDNQGMSLSNKASMCMDLANSLENGPLIKILKIVNDTFGKDFSNRIEFEQWVISIAIHEHTTIDHLCYLLGIDVQRFLETMRPYLSTEEIKRLVGDGFTIGAHSLGHQKLNALSAHEIEENITLSCKVIMTLTGKSQIPFAFPFTADGVSRELLFEIRDRFPYIGLFFNTNGIQLDRNFIISRICGDSPKNATQENSNLPQRITHAYVENLALRIQGL